MANLSNTRAGSLFNYSPISLQGTTAKPTTIGTIASLSGGKTQTGSGPYGTVPTVPDPMQTQAASLTANLSQMEQIQQIMEGINQQSAQSAMLPMTLNLPNYSEAMGQAMGNVQQYLGGQVPGDVWTQLQQSAAERGVGMGSPGSPAANSALLRALGLTSIGLQQTGQENLTSLMGAVPRGALWDPTSLLVTPAQVQEAQYMANVLKAAPDPVKAAAAEQEAIAKGLELGQGAGGAPMQIAPSPQAAPQVVNPNAVTAINPYAGSTGQYEYGYKEPNYAQWQKDYLGKTAAPTVAQSPYFGPANATVYPQSQYGLPTWADTASMMGGSLFAPGYNLGSWANQPTSQGQMYMGSLEGYGGPSTGYQEFPTGYNEGAAMDDWAAYEDAYWNPDNYYDYEGAPATDYAGYEDTYWDYLMGA